MVPNHTTLFDVERGTALDLGVGMHGHFSPDNRLMTWTDGDGEQDGEVQVLNLETMERWTLGPGYVASFIDERTIRTNTYDLSIDRRESVAIDVYTGERRPYVRVPSTSTSSPPTRDIPGGGRIVAQTKLSEARFRYVVYDPQGSPIVQFEAHRVELAGSDELLLTTPPADRRINVYLLSIPARAASFIATVAVDPGMLNVTLYANSSYVLWSAYCLQDSKVAFYDRKKSIIVELDVHDYARLTPSGLIALGAFGAKALVDPQSLRYKFALVAGGDTIWSPDYRYASQGISLGHGGLCG
jgi:hypothetical protein